MTNKTELIQEIFNALPREDKHCILLKALFNKFCTCKQLKRILSELVNPERKKGD